MKLSDGIISVKNAKGLLSAEGGDQPSTISASFIYDAEEKTGILAGVKLNGVNMRVQKISCETFKK